MRKLLGLILATQVLAGSVAFATDGHQMIGVGALQKGTAGAGVASAKDATWVLLNPAAIDGLDRRVDVSLEVFAPDRSITPDGPGLSNLGGAPLANAGVGSASDDSVFLTPATGVIIPLDNATLGFGLYGVNGMGVDYAIPRTSIPGASGQLFDRRTEYAVAKFAAAVAYPVGDGLVLGASIIGDIARFRADLLTASFAQTLGGWDWDTAYGVGFQLGVLKRFERLSVGASYISRQWMEEFDKYGDLFKGSLDIPQIVQAGLAYRLREDLEFVADYKFIDWDSVHQLGDAPANGGFGWEDQHVIKFGVEWTTTERCSLRGGFSTSESPIDEDAVFANALFPAIVEDHLTFGSSYRLTDRDDLHLAYMHAFENTLRESGGGDFFSVAGTGTEISLAENSYTLQYTRRF